MTSPAQLQLWGRARYGASAIEFKLHCMVADTLARWCKPEWRYTHIASGELRTPATAARLKRMGVKPGWPDFIFVGPHKTCFLELKRAGRKLSPEQAALATHLMQCGCGYGMTADFADAVTMLRDWGVVPANVHPQ